MGILGWIILLGAAGVLAYVRLAPIDVAAVHQPVEATQDENGAGHAVQVIPDHPGTLARLDAAMMAEPATSRLAGSVAQGRISYVSRSKWWGFPDYTTLEQRDGQIAMFGRLRFGRSDFGVNAARLKRVRSVL